MSLVILCMTGDDLLDEKAEAGNFTDLTDSLLPLFNDPDGRGKRRWEQVFGLARPPEPRRGGIRFSVTVRRKSSSGS